jgi:hypothetical protein
MESCDQKWQKPKENKQKAVNLYKNTKQSMMLDDIKLEQYFASCIHFKNNQLLIYDVHRILGF